MKKIFWGLKLKLYLASTLIVILSAIIICWSTINYNKKIVTDQLQDKAIALAKNLAHNSISAILANDELTLVSLVNGILKEHDVIFVSIYDRKNKIITQGGPYNVNKIPHDVLEKALNSHELLVQQYSAPHEIFIYDVTVPIHIEGNLEEKKSNDQTIDEDSFFWSGQEKESFAIKAGAVRLGISFKRSSELINIYRNRIIIINLTIYFIFLLIISLIVNSILTPVNQLLKGTRIIGEGNLNYRVKIKSFDEIGLLADSFNKMVENLNNSTTSISTLNKEIVERKFAEERLKEAYHDLKEAQQQVLQSSKLSAMGQMAAGISHELNQPLTGIKGYAQILAMDLGKDSPYLNDVHNIIEQANRMDSIIQNVRLFARKSDFKLSKLNVNDPIESSIRLLQEQLKIRNIKLSVNLEKNLPEILGDNNQLQQIFLNLITNGRDAIEKQHGSEGGQIIIKTERCKEDKYILVSFEDNGTGISPANLENIFNPFFTTKAPDGGMGLGLSIVYRIIENHKGVVDVESEEGKFTIFKIIFPIAEQKSKHDSHEA